MIKMVKYKDHHGKKLYIMVDFVSLPNSFSLKTPVIYGIIFSQGRVRRA